MSNGHSRRAIGHGRPANDSIGRPHRDRSSPNGTACTVPVRLGVSYAMSTPTITMRETLDAADDSGVAKVSKLL
jgi:hypothetical protein